LFLAFFRLQKEKKLTYFLILFTSLLVPLLLSQSYLFGLYLPYQRFVYFLLPPMTIFAAISFSYVIDLVIASYRKIKHGRKRLMKTITASILIIMVLILMFRFQTIGERINQGINYYSTSDVKAYDAAVWLRNNFPDAQTIVVTEKPGSWFGVYSGKMVIAQTDPTVEWNAVAESVLDFSYEIQHPLTMVRTLEAKDLLSDEICVSINNVWRRVSFLSEQEVSVSFNQNNVTYNFNLSDLNRNIAFEETGSPKFVIAYSNDEILLTKTILVHDDSYSIDVVWELTPLKSEISNASLYISSRFDASFFFGKAYIPGLLNWENPWDNPSYVAGNNAWVLVDFSSENMTEDYIGAYEEKNQVAFALKFVDLPDSGNMGALADKMIDAIRFQYQFGNIAVKETASSTYQILTFSKSSFPEMPQLSELRNMFDLKPASAFNVTTRDYADYIKENNIEFVVYDKSRFDIKLLYSNLLQLIYSNDEYVICEIKNSSVT
jgi:hypothetical protein